MTAGFTKETRKTRGASKAEADCYHIWQPARYPAKDHLRPYRYGFPMVCQFCATRLTALGGVVSPDEVAAEGLFRREAS